MDLEENFDFIKVKPDYNHWYYYYDNELIKKKKPCLPGNYIHVHRWEGCYLVHHVNIHTFTIKKSGKFVSLNWNLFKCLKGEGTSPESILKKREKTVRALIEIIKKYKQVI